MSLEVKTFGHKWLLIARILGLKLATGKCPDLKATRTRSHHCKWSHLQVKPQPPFLQSCLTTRLIAFNWQHVISWPLPLGCVSALHFFAKIFFFCCQFLVTAFTMLTCHCTLALGLSFKSILSLDWFDILPPIEQVIILAAWHIPHTPIVDCFNLDTCHISHHISAFHQIYFYTHHCACWRNCLQVGCVIFLCACCELMLFMPYISLLLVYCYRPMPLCFSVCMHILCSHWKMMPLFFLMYIFFLLLVMQVLWFKS